METKHKFSVGEYDIEITMTEFTDILQKHLNYHHTHPTTTPKEVNEYLKQILTEYKVA